MTNEDLEKHGKQAAMRHDWLIPDEVKLTTDNDYLVLINNNERVGVVQLRDNNDIHAIIFEEHKGKGYFSRFMRSGALMKVRPKLEILQTQAVYNSDEWNKLEYLANLADLCLVPLNNDYTSADWEPIDDWRDAFCGDSPEARALFCEFIKDFSFDQYWRSPCVVHYDKLLKGERGYIARRNARRENLPPYSDHAAAFRREGSSCVMYVFHSYDFGENLDSWCKERGIVCVECGHDRSFYNPGNTYMIMLISAYTYKKHSAVLEKWRSK